MKYRILARSILKALRSFPAVVVTGPRQSGKTTLVRNLLRSTHTHINLEDPDVGLRAIEDPRGFLDNLSTPVILDEIQYVSELLPYIKSKVDSKRKAGQWILTGLQNFVLMRGVSESLAGRAAVLSLLPFTLMERIGGGEESRDVPSLLKTSKPNPPRSDIKTSLAELVLRGSYPEIASKRSVDRGIWCGSYIATYLERDIRNLSQVGDLRQFELFLRLAATRTGQLLNISEIAREIGISSPTAARWISLLETGYQIMLLPPYYRNIGKRLVKSPKLYFNDTALACHLLGLRDTATLLNSPHFPHLFETFIIADFWKRYLHFGQMPSLYYMRTRDGLEIDLVVEEAQKLHLFEVKSGATITSKHAASLQRARSDLGRLIGSCAVIARSPESFPLGRDIQVCRWQDVLAT
ncbi:MAG: ATP-binding protein [Armatimonadetes bacterium]|nr:ATP-binding protein [Armatimonadota bacterium]